MAKRVLVVDDEVDTLNLLKMILEIHGFHPLATLNSVEAITLAEVEKAEVAILDIMMPKLDGFSLCKMMRLHPATTNMPIIFLTAYSALDLEDRRRDAGADYVLHKPIDLKNLVSVLENAHDIRRAAVEAAEKARKSATAHAHALDGDPKADAKDSKKESKTEKPSPAPDVKPPSA